MEGLAQTKAQTDLKVRACKGTAGTVTSRRPPQCSKKRAKFDKLNQLYVQARLQALNNEKGVCVLVQGAIAAKFSQAQ